MYATHLFLDKHREIEHDLGNFNVGTFGLSFKAYAVMNESNSERGANVHVTGTTRIQTKNYIPLFHPIDKRTRTMYLFENERYNLNNCYL